MTFEEAKVCGRELAVVARRDPTVLMVAGLWRQDYWALFVWRGRGVSLATPEEDERLAALYEFELANPGGTRPWFRQRDGVTLFYVKREEP